jgi:putative membrane protein
MKDPDEQAEEINEDKFNREGEKDADRLNDAYVASMFEVKASQNAISRASTAEVKKLAEMMVAAHSKMNTDIEALASRKNITLATDISDELNRKFEKLTEKNGLDYDKEYTAQMKNRQEEAIKLTDRAAEKAEDPEIKDWAVKNNPELRTHLDMIESTNNIIKDMKDDIRKDNMKDNHNGSHTDHDNHTTTH